MNAASSDTTAGGVMCVGDSPAFASLLRAAGKVAPRPTTVLIVGETGTGKELLARHIHEQSSRADQPFVPVDCTSFSEQLFESQLFGHVKGAFTGAIRDSLGFFRAADKGTIFLDELGELSLSLQSRLLRVLQERAVVPVGDTMPIPVDVRIVAATNRNLGEMVAAGTFRSDLYYRLKVVTLTVPPLRERPSDIAILARHFLKRLSAFHREPLKRLTASAVECLLRHQWPGNARELFNAMEHAFVFADGEEVSPVDLPPPLNSTDTAESPVQGSLNLLELERRAILEALSKTRWNRAAACRLLGVEPRRLNRRMKEFSIPLQNR